MNSIACLASYSHFLAAFVPANPAGRVHLMIAGQQPVADESRYGGDFYFRGDEELAYVFAPCRWVDDSSYAAYQAHDSASEYEEDREERCGFSAARLLDREFGRCERTDDAHIPF